MLAFRRKSQAVVITVSCFLLLVGVLVFPGFAQEATFKDVTAEMGLKMSTDAACWVDLDNDGWVDLCVSGGGWKNNAGKSFTRVADVPTSVAADYDNDGLVDLFSWSARRLYHNDGKMKFSPIELPKLPPSVSRGACWGDFNGDGFVDL